MIRFFDIENLDEMVLVDLLLEYTERCTNSFRGSTLGNQEYRDYKEAIEAISGEIRRRKAQFQKTAMTSGMVPENLLLHY